MVNTIELTVAMQRYEDDEDSTAMEDFLASSPPAWNADIPRPEHDDEEDWDDDVDGEIQDIPNAHFDVLDSSLPGYGMSCKGLADNSGGNSIISRKSCSVVTARCPFTPGQTIAKT